MQDDPHAPAFWPALADTPAALEQAHVDAGEPWTVSALAGLQYHAWRKDDGLDGCHEPQPGDRLQLVREPMNRYDPNAVAVEWRNGVRLGHLARSLAADVAGALDAGTSLRAYILSTGDGEDDGEYYARRFDRRAWSLRALLVGRPVAERHGEWTTVAAGRAERDVWGEAERHWDSHGRRWVVDPERRLPTERQRQAATAWDGRQCLARKHREAAAAAAFAMLDDGRPPLPEGAEAAPDEALRGKVFGWWDEVPACLMTSTALAKYGLRPVGEPYASISYAARRRWARYDLHVVANARPARARTGEQRAAAAAAAVLRRATRRWEEEDDAPIF